MGSIPRDYDEQCRFDAFCKSVLRNEAWNLKRNMKRQRHRITPLDTVPPTEWNKLQCHRQLPQRQLCIFVAWVQYVY